MYGNSGARVGLLRRGSLKEAAQGTLNTSENINFIERGKAQIFV